MLYGFGLPVNGFIYRASFKVELSEGAERASVLVIRKLAGAIGGSERFSGGRPRFVVFGISHDPGKMIENIGVRPVAVHILAPPMWGKRFEYKFTEGDDISW
jgi:hypothetical protein